MIVILMGVSGSGKTTIGRLLSEQLGWRLFDADEFHSSANIEKMRNGIALTDEDRWPWLDRMNAMLRERDALGESVLLACSALRHIYRERLAQGTTPIYWIHLTGSFELIRQRMEARQNHYMKAAMLQSQFAALEAPENAFTVDIGDAPLSIARSIIQRLQIASVRSTDPMA